MGYTKEDVINFINEEDVKFIRLTFCDLKGIQKNISIMPNELEKAFSKGILIDSSFVDGYEKNKRIVLHPDSNTISVLPWRPSQGRVVRMFCDLTTVDGEEIKESGRRLLKKAIKDNEDVDIKLKTEFEFYLFKSDDEGRKTSIPYDEAGYMDIAPEDKGENIRREICLSLDEMEIATSGSHHAEGPGQNRISIVEEAPLKAAENAITFESVVKTMATRNGLFADFSHIVKEDEPVSKHKIVIKAEKDKLKKYYVNLLKHYDEIYLFLNNTDYLYCDYDDKSNVFYDEYNDEIDIERVSYTSNSYIAYALVLYAINDERITNTKKAYTLQDAKNIAKESEFIKGIVPKEILEEFVK